MQSYTFYKAAGKILVAGGYGVLEEGNLGLSLAVDRHFYSITRVLEGPGNMGEVFIRVESPQIKS
jgi:phosphomevalonate kinase